MSNYQKLSELYAYLESLSFMRRNIIEAKENQQTKDHLFKLDVSPVVNSKCLLSSKIKYKQELLSIVNGEIQETKNTIAELSSKKP